MCFVSPPVSSCYPSASGVLATRSSNRPPQSISISPLRADWTALYSTLTDLHILPGHIFLFLLCALIISFQHLNHPVPLSLSVVLPDFTFPPTVLYMPSRCIVKLTITEHSRIHCVSFGWQLALSVPVAYFRDTPTGGKVIVFQLVGITPTTTAPSSNAFMHANESRETPPHSSQQ